MRLRRVRSGVSVGSPQPSPMHAEGIFFDLGEDGGSEGFARVSRGRGARCC